MSNAVLTITSEDDAWQALQSALENRLPDGLTEIAFTGWPVFHVKLRGEVVGVCETA